MTIVSDSRALTQITFSFGACVELSDPVYRQEVIQRTLKRLVGLVSVTCSKKTVEYLQDILTNDLHLNQIYCYCQQKISSNKCAIFVWLLLQECIRRTMWNHRETVWGWKGGTMGERMLCWPVCRVKWWKSISVVRLESTENLCVVQESCTCASYHTL